MTIVTTEQRANDLQAKVERLKSNLREAKRQHRELQQEAYDLHGHLRDSQRKLKKFRAKYPNLEVEENPFTSLLEDDDIPIVEEVPFDDNPTPLEA
ncbi:hypothetical protein B296_00045080 [Ensete ventricosum]|uniref:Uncharacterized protein n=1 Tax=Ensete ventricosum TaxID=4639 RepID=A0A426Z8K3_ENSVE|nr:hypothetical protein B296_00045080 [Ensete ventricosum]